MKDNLVLYLIYNYSLVSAPVYGPLTVGPQSHYYITDFFSEVGEIGGELLLQHYERFYGRPVEDRRRLGPFHSVEELTQYAALVCKDLLSPAVYVLSTFDFNRSVESIHDVRDLKEALQKNGKRMINEQLGQSKSHFFKRIFTEI